MRIELIDKLPEHLSNIKAPKGLYIELIQEVLKTGKIGRLEFSENTNLKSKQSSLYTTAQRMGVKDKIRVIADPKTHSIYIVPVSSH